MRLLVRIALVLPLALAGLSAAAQTAPPKASLEEQVEALRQGQAELMRELQDIKAMLKAGAKAGEAAPPAKPHIVANVFGEPFEGADQARVAILEYSDFDCPFCGRYAREIYPRLRDLYVKTGKIKYFFRDLPLPEHAQAEYKANLARVAGEQGRFWEAHDWLFAHQAPLDDKALGAFAQALGLDRAKLDEGIQADRYAPAIQASMASARRYQISGTPAFLIGILSSDGRVFTAEQVFLGAQGVEQFQEALDALLAPKAAAAPAPRSGPDVPAASTCG